MPKIKVIKEFKVGSINFFSHYNDYVIKDDDRLAILSLPINGNKSFLMKQDKKDIIMYPKLSKDEFIEVDLETNDSMKVGKYLIPEFIKYIDFTIDDLYKIKSLIDKLDDKHKYQKIIYDAYLENNSFTLTDEQRLNAYNEYKKYRKELYDISTN